DQRVAIHVPAEEDLEQEAVLEAPRLERGLVEPAAKRRLAGGGGPVEALVPSRRLLDLTRRRIAGLDQPCQGRVDMALHGRPEEADGVPDQLVELVARDLPVGKQPEHRGIVCRQQAGGSSGVSGPVIHYGLVHSVLVRKPLGRLWRTSGAPLGCLWGASGEPLGRLWGASGAPLGCLWGDAPRRRRERAH